MSARSEPAACCCRFCDEGYTAAGILNHERWCDENPHRGTHPDDAPELFDETTGDAAPSGDADPDQRAAAPDGGSLPPAESLPEGKKTGEAEEVSTCRNCGGTDLMPAHSARRQFARQMDPAPEALLATFDAAERYCNGCYCVMGGELPEPYCITEGFA